MAKWLLLASLAIELIGAFFMSFRFIPKLGWLKGIYFSIFHAVSSFCNAGLDLMGNFEVGSSLTTVKTDLLINIVIMLLIILGGLGFLVWQDLIEHRWHFKFYKLQTKVVLVTSGLLILIGAVVFLVFEFYAPAYKGLNAGEKVLASIFQSVSARTAGFQSVNLSDMNESGQFVMIFLMLIGGSSGSTAGGIKTTTFAVLMISIISVFRRRKSIECFKRRIDDSIVHNACCVMMFYLLLAGFSATIISFIEKVPFMTASFETVSAIATVGLSLGLTPTLSIPSQLIIILLMFIGRIGGLTLILAFTNRSSDQHSQYPVERITVG